MSVVKRIAPQIAVPALLTCVVWMAACDRETEANPAAGAPSESAQAAAAAMEFRVTGMTCDGCVAAIEGALARTPGVRQCTVDLDTGTAQVVASPEITPKSIIEAIRGIGAGQYDAKPAGS